MQTNEIIRQHPNNIHKATEAFTMTENSEKICKAFRHNVQTSNNNIFVTGDSVFYKQARDRRWSEKAKVLGEGWSTSLSQTW